MRNAIKAITFERGSADDDHGELIAWINGTVELYSGRKINAGGGWIEGHGVQPYDYADAGEVEELADALDCSGGWCGEAMSILRALCPPKWPLHAEEGK